MRKFAQRRSTIGFLLCLPLILLVAGFVIYPAFYAIYLSMLNKKMTAFVGLGNFEFLLKRHTFQLVIFQSCLFAITAVVLKALIGFILAHLMHNIPGKNQRIWRGLLLVPWVIPLALSTLTWWWMFDPSYSAFNWILNQFGFANVPWLGVGWIARFCTITVNVWFGTPFFMIMYLAALKSVPEQLYEAAAIDGAGRNAEAVLRHPADDAQHHRDHRAVQPDRDVRRLRHRPHPDRGRAAGHDPCLRHLRLPGRHPVGRHPAGRGRQPVHVPDPGLRGILRAARRDPAHQGDRDMSATTLERGRHASRPRARHSLHRQRLWALWGSYIALGVFVVMFLVPPFYTLMTSLKSSAEISAQTGSPWLVHHPTLENFWYLITYPNFQTYYLNSVIVTVLTVAVSMVISVLAAFSLSRMGFWGSQTLSTGVFLTYLVPPSLLFIPLFQIIGKLGLINNFWCLVLLYPTLAVPFCTWIMIGYFSSIPKELDEAALIDGAGYLQMLWRIFIPVAMPGIIAATIFAFTVAWGAFLYPLAYLYTSNQMVLTVGIISDLIRGDVFQWGKIMAACLLASLPPIIIYAFLMDYYVAGLTAGATKG